MADMEHPDVFKAGSEGRIEETKYLQGLQSTELQEEQKPSQEREHLSAYETMREYTIALEALSEYLRQVTKEMDTMRLAGIPDRAAYEKLREGLTQKYEQFRDLSQRMVDLAENKNKTGDAARKMARILIQEDRREELEDAYLQAVEADTKANEGFAAEAKDLEDDHATAEYETAVKRIMSDVVSLDNAMEHSVQQKTGLTQKKIDMLRAGLFDAFERLQNVDEQYAAKGIDPESVQEHKVLLDLMGRVRTKYTELPVAAASPLSDSRTTYRTVKAQYAAVQHTLSEDQRRAMRLSIATMRDAVVQAEDDAWQKMFGGSFTRAPQEQFEPIPPPEPPAQTSIRLAVAHATEHAPALATAALASMPTVVSTPKVAARRGLFAALGDAFKLR